MKYLLQIAYDGTNYHGWQIQPNAITIQQILQDKIKILLKEPEIKLIGSGRTDAGVHALNQYAHFSYHKELNKNFLQKLNIILPPDIVVKKIFQVPENFNARHSAIKRSYSYFITFHKNPFIRKYSWQLKQLPDINKMNQQANLLLGNHDFTSLSKKGTQVKHNLCNIYYAKFKKWKYGLIFHIEANRFLRAMVRFIVGTLIEIGTNKKQISIPELLQLKNNKYAAKLAPPTGLFLQNVKYPENQLKLIYQI